MAFAGTRTRGSACGCCSCTITGTFSSLSGTQDLEADPMTATGAGEVLWSGAPASFTDPIYLCVTIRTDDDPAVIQIPFNRTDSNNYHFAEIAVSGGVVTGQFGKCVGGVQSYIGTARTITGADLSAATTICICFRPGESQAETPGQQTSYAFRGDDETNGWTDTEQITADDGVEATITPTGDSSTDALLAYFGFAIPGGAVIVGIEGGANVEYESDDGMIVDGSVTFNTSAESGDNVAGGTQVPDDGSNGTQVWGGPTDLCGLAPTWDQINDQNNFVMRMVWAALGSVGSSPLGVDWVACTIYYVLPPYTPGEVTLSVDGECIAKIKLAYLDDGLGVGLKFDTGDWEFSGFSLSYAETEARPSCPSCCETTIVPCGCCSGETSSQYSVDLGTTGFVDTGCNCDAITGPFVVDIQGSAGVPPVCHWIHQDPAKCNLLISLQLFIQGDDCFWLVTIFTDEGRVTYMSSVFDFDDCPEGEVSLAYFSGNTTLCGAAVPASISIEPL